MKKQKQNSSGGVSILGVIILFIILKACMGCADIIPPDPDIDRQECVHTAKRFFERCNMLVADMRIEAVAAQTCLDYYNNDKSECLN